FIQQSRKTTELTMAIIQQVACQRGIAALPIWAVSEYLEKKYVTAKSITENKLISEVWLATLTENIDKGYVNDFIGFTRQRCLRLLDEI
ncbi:LysR family transcriptional regulator, partial [Klebsiella pneumoniae]|nr:LysR family transcriptional regulator [Klebsiella pneumoniae]MCW9319532.1 LysR family transcriptional regulator [Klebsiella pneumoniae]